MAKIRHKIFEMYEFRDEAVDALTPTSAQRVTKDVTSESWTFSLCTIPVMQHALTAATERETIP